MSMVNTYSEILRDLRKRITDAKNDLISAKEVSERLKMDTAIARRILRGHSFATYYMPFSKQVECVAWITVRSFKEDPVMNRLIKKAKLERLAHRDTSQHVGKYDAITAVTYGLPGGGELILKFSLDDQPNGTCRKVLVGEESEVITKPVYKIICD